MKIVPFSNVTKTDWDSVCGASGQAWLYHSADWIEIERKFFAKANLSFALYSRSRIVGIQPLYLSECGLGTWVERLINSGVHRHAGLAIVEGLDHGEIRAARTEAIREVHEAAQRYGADRIQLNVQNLAPENLIAGPQEVPFWVEDYGYQLGLNFGPLGMLPAPGLSTCCADQIVRLDGSEEELFLRLDESCRRAIRKAQKLGMVFQAGKDRGCVEEYYHLARRSAARTGEALLPPAYFFEVWGRFSHAGRCAFLFACLNGDPVAALVVLIYKRAASFLAGVSDPARLHLRGNDFLHWSAMLWAKRAGCSVYRLGPSFPEVPADWPIARIGRFKTKFGGRPKPVIQGSFYLHREKYAELAAQHVQLLCSLPASAGRTVRGGVKG